MMRAGDFTLLEFFEDGRLELYNVKDDIGQKQEPGQGRCRRRRANCIRRCSSGARGSRRPCRRTNEASGESKKGPPPLNEPQFASPTKQARLRDLDFPMAVNGWPCLSVLTKARETAKRVYSW